MDGRAAILTINAGSSSVKFEIFDTDDALTALAEGQVSGIGGDCRFRLKAGPGGGIDRPMRGADHDAAVDAILAYITGAFAGLAIAGVGHRVVHGGTDFDGPAIIDDAVVAALETLSPFAPLHQPANLGCIRAARAVFPEAVHVACFDTAFHRTHPFVNDTFGLPPEYYAKGVRRYGFHGLSYQYMVGHLEATEPVLADGRVVVAHLGNGASMCAIRDGRSIASTMGFTALDGLMMGTRCGQLDPGVVLYLMQNEGMSADDVARLLYHGSGLKGMSGLSNDMRVLLASDKLQARQAIDYYVFRIRRELGAMAAVLGGLDGVVFCGGIGENAAQIRSMVCDGMDWLGIDIDETLNTQNARDIGIAATRVLVIPTDEERVMARSVLERLPTVKIPA